MLCKYFYSTFPFHVSALCGAILPNQGLQYTTHNTDKACGPATIWNDWLAQLYTITETVKNNLLSLPTLPCLRFQEYFKTAMLWILPRNYCWWLSPQAQDSVDNFSFLTSPHQGIWRWTEESLHRAAFSRLAEICSGLHLCTGSNDNIKGYSRRRRVYHRLYDLQFDRQARADSINYFAVGLFYAHG